MTALAQPIPSTDTLQRRDAVAATAHEGVLVRAWAKRRPAWTRTESARWLDARSEQVLAWLRRRTSRGPGHSRQMGYWLKDNEPAIFDRAHAHLAALTTRDREAAMPHEVLR